MKKLLLFVGAAGALVLANTSLLPVKESRAQHVVSIGSCLETTPVNGWWQVRNNCGSILEVTVFSDGKSFNFISKLNPGDSASAVLTSDHNIQVMACPYLHTLYQDSGGYRCRN